MTKQQFETLLEFIPPGVGAGSVVVAGGFAADPQRASDVDLWVLARGEMEDTKDLIQNYLIESGVTFLAGRSVPAYPSGRMLVATIPAGFEGNDVQLLVAAYDTPRELVNSFDISTHAVGYYENWKHNVNRVEGRGFTPLTAPVRVLRFDTPEDTLSRLHKITQRYAQPPVAADVERLVELIRESHAVSEKTVVSCGVAA